MTVSIERKICFLLKQSEQFPTEVVQILSGSFSTQLHSPPLSCDGFDRYIFFFCPLGSCGSDCSVI